MSPGAASIVCTGFVFYVFWVESRRRLKISSTVWLPTIWLCLVSSKPLGVWFVPQSSQTADMDSGSPLDRLVLIVFLVLGLLILIKRGFGWANAVKGNRLLALLLVFSLLSILWS